MRNSCHGLSELFISLLLAVWCFAVNTECLTYTYIRICILQWLTDWLLLIMMPSIELGNILLITCLCVCIIVLTAKVFSSKNISSFVVLITLGNWMNSNCVSEGKKENCAYVVDRWTMACGYMQRRKRHRIYVNMHYNL